MRQLLNDFLYAARSLSKSRSISFAAVAILSVGVGLNAVIFSLADAAVLEPLPYTDPDQLVILHWQQGNKRGRGDVSARAYYLAKDQAKSFASTAAMYPLRIGVNLSDSRSATYVKALPVSSDYFSVLRVFPAYGREFRAEEYEPGNSGAAILSFRLWAQQMGKAPGVLGRQIRVNDVSYTIVGVMPEGFHSFPDADLWLSLQLSPLTADLGNNYRVIARLRDGYSIEQAQRELTTISSHERLRILPTSAQSFLVCEKLKDYVGGDLRSATAVIFSAAMLILLIACMNVAVLVTIRSLARTHEMSVRLALGSPRHRIARVFFLESLLLALVGGVLGAILAKESLGFVLHTVPLALRSGAPIRIDMKVLLFALATSTGTALVFGLGPAVKMSRRNINELLKCVPRGGTASVTRNRAGKLLIALQAALAVILLNISFALLQSFLRLHAVPPGFDPTHVWAGQVLFASGQSDTGTSNQRVLERVFTQLRAVPAVESVSSTISLPTEKGLNLPIYPMNAPDNIEHAAEYEIISPDYFRTLRIPIQQGRDFTAADGQASAPVAIINRTLAERWWPNGMAVGEFVRVSSEAGPQLSDAPRKIVAVVSDVRAAGLDRPPSPTIFIPVKQAPENLQVFVNRLFLTSIIVRLSSGGSDSALVRTELENADPRLPLASWRPLDAVLASSLDRPRFYAVLTLSFGALALFLTGVGVYAVLRYHSDLRVREIGLRMLLGANRFQVIGPLLVQGLTPVVFGTVIGMVVAKFAERMLDTMLYNDAHIGIGAILGSAIVLNSAACAACILSSFRIISLQPVDILRSE